MFYLWCVDDGGDVVNHRHVVVALRRRLAASASMLLLLLAALGAALAAHLRQLAPVLLQVLLGRHQACNDAATSYVSLRFVARCRVYVRIGYV